MKTVGIIVEYNPLHNGHVLHYAQSKAIAEADSVIAVMSGPFLQRGEPALVGKRARTEMALRMGADLVIELPTAYAVQPAEWFAHGAVALLAATGVVDSLCFGSESGSLDTLLPLAGRLAEESQKLREEIAFRMSSGISFPNAYAAAAAAVSGSDASAGTIAEMLAKPNNSLGLHYLIALKRLGSGIVPYTIPRKGAQYHDQVPASSSIASATSVRKLILEQGLEAASPYIPSYTYEILRREFDAGQGPNDWESFRLPLFHALLTRTPGELDQLHEVREGLEYRIQKVLPLLDEPHVGQLIDALKTKRYTRTKLQRMLLHILLNHTKREMTREQLAQGPGYIRVLGFTSKGQALLKQMKKTASLPVIMKPSKLEHPQLRFDLQASAVYGNACPRPSVSLVYGDYLLPPVTL